MPPQCVKLAPKLVQMAASGDSEHMPSGRVHLRIEAVLLFVWTAVGGWLLAGRLVRPEAVVAFVLAYAFSMILLSPDLDLARSCASKRWGAARVLWMPYALLFKHRGRSHHPIFGALTRILYLLLVGGLLWALVVGLLGARIPLWLPTGDVLAAIFGGLYMPNLTHILADRLVSARRARRKLWSEAKRAKKRL